MVDLDSNPTKLIEIVEIGKQLLITRGALTTFSIANDVAKYFAMLPAMFSVAFPALQKLNILHLSSPQSAITSAIIFNALIIIALIPLALRGVAYHPIGASSLLRRNLLIYGVGGLIVPFIGIKLIEIVEIGKQLLMTRGALTTFSIANDVAKYFAMIPAMFIAFYPQLGILNVMHLSTPQSAILSAIIFNAIIIIALIPLALKGVAYRAVGAAALLRRNLMIYGVGGIIIPFIGIKAIDLVVAALHLA